MLSEVLKLPLGDAFGKLSKMSGREPLILPLQNRCSAAAL